jgi:hypothetical protein
MQRKEETQKEWGENNEKYETQFTEADSSIHFLGVINN